MICIRHIYISPGHNYRGHHGKPPGVHPILEVEQVECVAGRGLKGDRYFDHKQDYKGQITFFAWEVYERFRQELELNEAAPSNFRRNVITAGIDLNTIIGQEFELQGVRFYGVEECRPCYWMNEAFRNSRAEDWLKGNGGLRARILTDGVLRCDAS
jgi:MOSC domain-containing protein YiiM